MAIYQKPDWVSKHIFNPMIKLLIRMGLGVRGGRILYVKGRKSGRWRNTPVNPLSLGNERYLVAPRGVTPWVRNIRESREGTLRLGFKEESIRVEEVPDEDKPEILRAYLKYWRMETGRFFGGVSDTAPEEELRRIAPNHPVFRILKDTPSA